MLSETQILGSCKGSYLLAIFTGISGTTGINGSTGTAGIIVVIVGVCAVNGGEEEVLGVVDDELGETTA